MQLHPQSAVGIGNEALYGTNGESSGSGLLEELEVQTVEANQTLFGADPKIAVPALRDGRDGAAGKAALAAPAVMEVFGLRAADISGASEWEKTDKSHDDEKQTSESPGARRAVKGGRRISQRRPPPPFQEDSVRWR